MASRAMITNWVIPIDVSYKRKYGVAARFVLLSSLLQGCSLRAIPAPWPALRSSTTLFCYSEMQDPPSTSIESLRSQLEALHSEAEQARARANTARARFLRLTETIENLRTRAVIDLRDGREVSARQLLAEKQKVMQALEKSKQRAQLLEELSNKLSEVISSKELQLITVLSSTQISVDESSNAPTSVRIVSPKAHDDVAAEVNGGLEKEDADGLINQSLSSHNAQSATSTLNIEALEPSDDVVGALLSTGPDTYPRFLSRVDDKLHEVEMQLQEFLSFAAMILPEDASFTSNEKVATVKQIWHDVLSARARIRKVVEEEEDMGQINRALEGD